MRLKTFVLNEDMKLQYERDVADKHDEIVKTIKRDCKKWLSEIKYPIYRGVKNTTDIFIKKDVRTDRRPTDSPEDYHNILNDVLYEKFGWKPRTEGLFTARHISQAIGYSLGGSAYVVFPIGDYKYIYSNTIADMYTIYDYLGYDDFNEFIDDVRYDSSVYSKFEKLIKETFTDKDLNNNFDETGEVMIKCKSYYGLKVPSYAGIKDNKTLISLLKDIGIKEIK